MVKAFYNVSVEKLKGLKVGLSGFLLVALGFVLLFFSVETPGWLLVLIGLVVSVIGLIMHIRLMFAD